MTDTTILTALQAFLQQYVAPRIQLQKPSEDASAYELVHPAVHIGWIPPKNFLPEGMESEIPCMVVGMDDGQDSGEEASLRIRISFVVYNPGTYDMDGKLTPNFQGYQDLLNLITLARQELSRNMVIEGVTSLQKPFKWGMYTEEQPYPYWYGWLTFEASCAVMRYVPTINQQYEIGE